MNGEGRHGSVVPLRSIHRKPREVLTIRAFLVAIALPAAVVATIAGVTAADSNLGSISGTVAYRERIALPPDATVTVTIQDVRPEAPVTLAETTFVPNRQVPIPFLLSYSKSAVVPSHDYVVRATISMDGRPRFTSKAAYPVITKGHADRVTMLLIGVETQSGGDNSLDRTLGNWLHSKVTISPAFLTIGCRICSLTWRRTHCRDIRAAIGSSVPLPCRARSCI